MVRERIIAAIAGHRICPGLHSQHGLIIARSLTKKHIERIKHPAYDFNNVMRAYAIRITQNGWSHSGMLMETSGRAVGGDVPAFQKQGDIAQK